MCVEWIRDSAKQNVALPVDNYRIELKGRFLENFKVSLHGFDEECQSLLADDCFWAGANVIQDNDYSGEVDLLVMPVDAMIMEGIKVQPKLIVNQLWLVRCSI